MPFISVDCFPSTLDVPTSEIPRQSIPDAEMTSEEAQLDDVPALPSRFGHSRGFGRRKTEALFSDTYSEIRAMTKIRPTLLRKAGVSTGPRKTRQAQPCPLCFKHFGHTANEVLTHLRKHSDE